MALLLRITIDMLNSTQTIKKQRFDDIKKLTRIKHRSAKRLKIKNSRDMKDKIRRSNIHLFKEYTVYRIRDILFNQHNVFCNNLL